MSRSDAAGRGFAGPGREHGLRHLEEHRRLPGVVLAGAADGLVGLGGDGEVRVQRVQAGRHVARRDQAVDRVGVALPVHDPGGKDLIAEDRRTDGAGARVADRRRLAHVVHVDAARRRPDGEVPLRVARQHDVLAAAALEGGGHGGRRQQHPALRAGRPSGGLEQRRRLRRVDAHADAREELERRRADGLDRLGRPEVGGERVARRVRGGAGVSAEEVMGGPSLSKARAGPYRPSPLNQRARPAGAPAPAPPAQSAFGAPSRDATKTSSGSS